MKYKRLCEIYESLEGTKKGLEKTKILSDFLEEIKDQKDFIYLLTGKAFPQYDPRELGISQQLVIKAIGRSMGEKEPIVLEEFKKTGELGNAAEVLAKERKQVSLFCIELTIEKVLNNLRKIPTYEGKGATDKKLGLIVELLNSSSGIEAKYIIRTVLGDLKIGVGEGILRDAIAEFCFSPRNLEEKRTYCDLIQDALNKTNDFGEVFEKACEHSLDKIQLSPGKPLRVMLFPKAKNVEDAFRIVGRPAAFEYKYDGFRVMINKSKDRSIKIFTRRLEEVTTQFPEIVKYALENIKGDSFILDAEAVGFDSKTKKYTDFQAISQRIRRKYEIEKMAKTLPIELVLFDIVYFDGVSLIQEEFMKRRKLLQKIVKQEPYKIILAKQIISKDVEEIETFYEKALRENQEGLMAKSLSAPYKPGARVGYAVKLKPEDKDFDLVITGAEWGTGKRVGWLTSFNVSCRDESGELLEIGKVSTGLKELEGEGATYEEMTEMLKEITIKETGREIKVEPKIVVTVQYQNIQISPTYSSGLALRFPRITRIRPDRSVEDIATVEEIGKLAS